MPDPKRTARWIFDLAVVAALISSVVMITMGRWEPAIRFGIVAVIMLIARFGDVPPSFAGAFAVLLLLATWASVEHWYRQINNFDLLVHFLTPGSLAAVTYFVLAHLHLMPAVGRSSERLLPGRQSSGSRWSESLLPCCGISMSGWWSRSLPPECASVTPTRSVTSSPAWLGPSSPDAS